MALLRAREPTLCTHAAGGALSPLLLSLESWLLLISSMDPVVPAWVPEVEIDVTATTSIAALKRNNDDYVCVMLQNSFASEL